MALATGLRSLRMQMQMPAGLRRGYAQFASMSLHRQLQTQRSSPANAGKILVYGVSTTALRASSTSLPPSRQSNERNDGRKRNARISNASNADAFSQVSKPPKIKDYEFLDCGDLKRLERFGVVYVSRSCPAAVKRVEYAANRDWSNPQMVKYHGNSGKPGMWYNKNYIPKDWSVQFDLGLPGLSADKDNAAPVSYTPTNAPDVTFHLEESRLGQVGVFPEQEENWRWIASTVRHSLLQRYVQRASQETAAETEGDASAHSMRRYTVLNAFAYTGGSTMAALAATNVQGDDNNENLRDEMLNDLDVIHLDASRSFVNRAIKNAHSCSVDFILPNTTRKLGLVSEGNGDAALRSPVRWIVEDTVTYLRRKLNKGMELDGLILDPPAFGRAPNGT
jgi:23S rRNA (cytosine1962-C5)-methyltransferase